MSEINATVQEEIDLIVKAARGERFHFIVVAYDHLSLVERVKKALIEKYPEREVTSLKVGVESNTDFIQNILETPAGLVFIDDFELLLKNEVLALGFNQKRDLITKLAIALVCFVPFDRKLLQECPRKIPDMWSVRSLLAELRGYFSQKSTFILDDLQYHPYRDYSLQEKEEEINSLQKRIDLIDENTESLGLRGQLYQNLGELLYNFGRYNEAVIAIKKALTIFEQIGDEQGKSQMINLLGGVEFSTGNYTNAISYFKTSLNILQQIEDRLGEGRVLNNLSQVYDAKGDYDTALHFLKQSLLIQQQIGDKSGESTTLNNIAGIYQIKGDYKTTLHYLEQSLTISQKVGDRSGESTALINISKVYNILGEYNTALSLLEQSLAITREIGDIKAEAAILNNISQIYDTYGDYNTALHFLEQSLTIRQKITDRSGESITLNNIGQIHYSRGDYDSALHYLEKSLSIQQEIGNRSLESTILHNIGQLYNTKGEHDIALNYLEQSLVIQKEIGNRSGLSATLHNIATIYLNYKDNLEKYLELETLAYQTAHEIMDTNAIYQIGWYLGGVLCQLGAIAEGLPILQIAYQAGLQAGYPNIEELSDLIKEYSTNTPI